MRRHAPRKLVCLETYGSDRHVQAFRERSVRPFFEGLAAQLEPPLAVAHRFMDSPAQLAAYTRRKEGLLWRYLRQIHDSVLEDFAPARSLGHVLHIRGR